MLFGDGVVGGEAISGFKLAVFLRSLGHRDLQSAVHTLLAYGRSTTGSQVPRRCYAASFNTEGLSLPQWGAIPLPQLTPDEAWTAVRAVLIKRVGGLRHMAVFFNTDGTVGLPRYDAVVLERPERPDILRCKLGSSGLSLAPRYAGCIRLLNRSAVSTARGAAVAHLFTLE